MRWCLKMAKNVKKVSFVDASLYQVYSEDPDLKEELRVYRLNLEEVRSRMDRNRLERILTPILTSEHREKIRSQLTMSQDHK